MYHCIVYFLYMSYTVVMSEYVSCVKYNYTFTVLTIPNNELNKCHILDVLTMMPKLCLPTVC